MSQISLCIVRGAVHEAQIDSNAIVNVVGGSKAVATATKSDVPVSSSVTVISEIGKSFEDESYFFSGRWLDQTPRMQATGVGPPAVDAIFVLDICRCKDPVGQAGGKQSLAL